jgi:hypothetical protein
VPNEWNWPDEMDALQAAPEHHVCLFENEHVRVIETVVPPGHKTGVHTHRYPGSQYILTWSHFIRRDHAGAVQHDSREHETVPHESAHWIAATPPHTVENIGDKDLRVITVELKNT